LPWEDLFKPAIDLCVNGFKIPNALANALSSKEKEIRKDSVLSSIFINNATNKLLKQNDTAYFRLLGETLKKISKSNTSDIFYNSNMTKNIIAEMNENGLIFFLSNES
jgi:gamma-glutamyltranspeptidase / glutathione hydrolase / leukotriene-C4 hydrolase